MMTVVTIVTIDDTIEDIIMMTENIIVMIEDIIVIPEERMKNTHVKD